MKVILCEDVVKVGAQGETLDVSDGFARNFLLPKNLALPATHSNLKKWEAEKKTREIKANLSLETAKNLATQLAGVSLQVSAKSGKEGQLFGSVTTAAIAEAIHAQGFTIDKKNIEMESPIKTLGEHTVSVRLHREVTATLKVNIVPNATP